MHSAQCGTLSHAVSARVFGTCFAWNGVHGILLLSSLTCMYNELTSHILTCSMTTQRAVTIGTVLKSTCDEAGLVPASSEAAARTPSPLFPYNIAAKLLDLAQGWLFLSCSRAFRWRRSQISSCDEPSARQARTHQARELNTENRIRFPCLAERT